MKILIYLNITTFKLKLGYYLELLTTETMKLVGSSEEKRWLKTKNDEILPHLKITEVLLVHFNLLKMLQIKSKTLAYICSL